MVDQEGNCERPSGRHRQPSRFQRTALPRNDLPCRSPTEVAPSRYHVTSVHRRTSSEQPSMRAVVTPTRSGQDRKRSQSGEAGSTPAGPTPPVTPSPNDAAGPGRPGPAASPLGRSYRGEPVEEAPGAIGRSLMLRNETEPWSPCRAMKPLSDLAKFGMLLNLLLAMRALKSSLP